MNLKNHVKYLTKTAMNTGASSAIGYAFTKLFARDGYKLVLVARSESKLSQLAENFREKFGTFVRVIPVLSLVSKTSCLP